MNAASIPPDVLLGIAVVAVVLALLQALVLLGRRRMRRRRMSLRMERAVLGEEQAPALLAAHGFTVTGAQVTVEHVVRIDDRDVVIPLRADYLAEKRGSRYAVEVKTGALAPRIETSATRRQILEYRIAFDVDGVVLVDAESRRVHEITFPALERLMEPAPSSSWRVAALAFAAVAAAVAALVRLG